MTSWIQYIRVSDGSELITINTYYNFWIVKHQWLIMTNRSFCNHIEYEWYKSVPNNIDFIWFINPQTIMEAHAINTACLKCSTTVHNKTNFISILQSPVFVFEIFFKMPTKKKNNTVQVVSFNFKLHWSVSGIYTWSHILPCIVLTLFRSTKQ